MRRFFLHNVRLQLTIPGGSIKKKWRIQSENSVSSSTKSPLGLGVVLRASARRMLQVHSVAAVYMEMSYLRGVEKRIGQTMEIFGSELRSPSGKYHYTLTVDQLLYLWISAWNCESPRLALAYRRIKPSCGSQNDNEDISSMDE